MEPAGWALWGGGWGQLPCVAPLGLASLSPVLGTGLSAKQPPWLSGSSLGLALPSEGEAGASSPMDARQPPGCSPGVGGRTMAETLLCPTLRLPLGSQSMEITTQPLLSWGTSFGPPLPTHARMAAPKCSLTAPAAPEQKLTPLAGLAPACACVPDLSSGSPRAVC